MERKSQGQPDRSVPSVRESLPEPFQAFPLGSPVMSLCPADVIKTQRGGGNWAHSMFDCTCICAVTVRDCKDWLGSWVSSFLHFWVNKMHFRVDQCLDWGRMLLEGMLKFREWFLSLLHRKKLTLWDYTGVTQSWHCWHFGPDSSLLWGLSWALLDVYLPTGTIPLAYCPLWGKVPLAESPGWLSG